MHRSRGNWTFAWLVLATLVGCGDTANQSASAASLAYEEFPGNDAARIVRVAGDGTHRKVLWVGGHNITTLAPSPDGRSILFADETGWLLLPTGSGAAVPMTVPVAGSLVATQPAWAPDGSAIAWIMYNLDPPNFSRLTVTPPGSAGATLITPDSLNVLWAAWSANSDQLSICTQNGFSSPMLYALDRDGSNLHAITPDTLFVECRQAWSPGTRIAFVAAGPRTVNPDGSGLAHVPMNSFPQEGFSGPLFWAPNARTLAITSEYGQLWSVDVETGATSYFRVSATGTNPWSPQGDFLAFQSDTTRIIGEVPFLSKTISIMRADGTGKHRITPDSVNAFLPVWLPDPQ